MNFQRNNLPMTTFDPPSTSFHQKLHRLSLTKPLIMGYMSVDGAREYHSNLSQLKFLKAIPRGEISLDLNHNIFSAVKRTTDDNDEKITLCLRFLLDQYYHLRYEISQSSFICYRRTLISIMCNAYGIHEPLIIIATLFNGSIYLCSLKSQEEIRKSQSRSKEEAKYCAWGYKFEQYLLSESLNTLPDIHKPVIENEEFSMYYSANLGNKKLLYGAQIDGLLATHKIAHLPETTNVDTNLEYLRKNSFIELKTNRQIQNYKQERSYKRYKLLRCWCQCYLADLKGLLVGYRTDDGIIQHLQWFDTSEIVSYCKDVWNPQTAIDYLDYVLSYIQNSFHDRNCGELTTLQFEFCKNGRILINNVEKDMILPNWYVETIKSYAYFVVLILLTT